MRTSIIRSALHLVLALSILVSLIGLVDPAKPVRAEVSTSLFGYSYSIQNSVEFSSISDSQEILFDLYDDDIVGPIDLGFSFPFFEFQYDSLYINTNGVIMFGADVNELAVNNTTIPSDQEPNNIIAPFWDDLYLVEGSRVFVKQSLLSNPKVFTIEFNNVTRLGGTSTDHFTFQIILSENGDISFIFGEMLGDLSSSTIGIEDADGVDGIQLLNNGVGELTFDLLPSRVDFFYPENPSGFKVMPSYQSDLLISGYKDFPIIIKNTGTLSAIYQLWWSNIDFFDASGWNVTFLDEFKNPLVFENISSTYISGSIAPGLSKNFYVRVSSPSTVPTVGSFILGNVNTKKQNSSLESFVTIQAANPAPFIQAFSELGNPAMYKVIHPRQAPDYPGLDYMRSAMSDYDWSQSLAVSHASGQRYVSAWEDFQYIFSNVKFAIGDISVNSIQSLNVFDNEDNPVRTLDRSPFVAVSQDGTIAITYIRDIENNLNQINSNVMLARINSNGQVLEIHNLSQNNLYGDNQELEIPFFNSPRVIVQNFNQFIVTWEENKVTTTGSEQSLYIAKVNSDGLDTSSSCMIPKPANSSINRHSTLNLSGTANFFLSYFLSADDENVELKAAVINSTDICTISAESTVSSVNGRSLDMVQVGATQILLGWVNLDTSQIQTLLVDSVSLPAKPSPLTLNNPDGRNMNSLSMVNAPGDLVVLTWENSDRDRLYYALLNSLGEVVTPAMIFDEVTDSNGIIQTGLPGESLAPLTSPLIFVQVLPVIQR